MKKVLLFGLFFGACYGSDHSASEMELPLLAEHMVSSGAYEHKSATQNATASENIPPLPLFQGLQLNVPIAQESPTSYKDMNQFKQAVAISNTVRNIVDILGYKGMLKEVTHVPFAQCAPQPKCHTSSGFEWGVHQNGTHSLISTWGMSDMVKNVSYKPRIDGFDPSGTFDQQLIEALGLQISTLQHGPHFCDDAEPEFLHPNFDTSGQRILNDEGRPVRYVVTNHALFDKPAQFKVGEAVEEKELLHAWQSLQKKFKEEKAQKIGKPIKNWWRSKQPQKMVERPPLINQQTINQTAQRVENLASRVPKVSTAAALQKKVSKKSESTTTTSFMRQKKY